MGLTQFMYSIADLALLKLNTFETMYSILLLLLVLLNKKLVFHFGKPNKVNTIIFTYIKTLLFHKKKSVLPELESDSNK
jgi:hypothetical protein